MGSGPVAKQLLVQRRPKLGIWDWVEGLAKWVNRPMFTNLRNLQWGTRSDPESKIAVVLTDSIYRMVIAKVILLFNHLTTFLELR